MNFSTSHRAEIAKSNGSAQKARFPSIPERAIKNIFFAFFFCIFFAQKVRSCTLEGVLSGIRGKPIFCAD